MRAPDTKKPVRPTTSGALKVPKVERMGSPRVLLSGSAASEHQLREALLILNPPSAERESWREKIHQALASLEMRREMHWSDRAEFDEHRSRGRPPNTRARDAVELTRSMLEMRGLELTTLLKGKWHCLSQIFADSSSDLRHHLHDSLRDSPLAEKS
jgi:hypothetical protein